jgi:hypothetical protein
MMGVAKTPHTGWCYSNILVRLPGSVKEQAKANGHLILSLSTIGHVLPAPDSQSNSRRYPWSRDIGRGFPRSASIVVCLLTNRAD